MQNLFFGDSIRAISQSSDTVQVGFTKNSPREFDLLIGADGLHSRYGQSCLVDDSRFVRDLGLYLCVYTVPNYLNLKEMRPFVMLNQVLGIKSANLMRSKEKKNVFMWLLEQIMRIAPGRMIEFFIDRSTRRIHQAANAITLKDYSA
jgi:hypothetical protein